MYTWVTAVNQLDRLYVVLQSIQPQLAVAQAQLAWRQRGRIWWRFELQMAKTERVCVGEQ